MKKMGWLVIATVGLVSALFLRTGKGSASAGALRQPLYYIDPMHPSYRSASPGIAPDCGMKLVPVYAEDVGREHDPASAKTPSIRIGQSIRQLYGIQTAVVEKSSGQSTIHVYGRIAADESEIYRVDLGADGYVKKTMGDAVGSRVSKNQHLAVVYSPDFLSVSGGYLSATERTPETSSKGNVVQAASQNSSSATARADRLRNLGMSDAQIEEITLSRKIPEEIYVVSPIDGFVLSRAISAGMRFEKHTEFYRIANLSHVWVLAQVFEGHSYPFSPGAVVRVTLPGTRESFTAKLRDVLPEVDPETHALLPRLQVDNPGLRLRPGMYVDIEVLGSPLQGLSVPVDAVINTGTAKRVFVEITKDEFEQRQVETGATFGDRLEILTGLKEGERVVSSGMFLMDSETSMHSR